MVWHDPYSPQLFAEVDTVDGGFAKVKIPTLLPHEVLHAVAVAGPHQARRFCNISKKELF